MRIMVGTTLETSKGMLVEQSIPAPVIYCACSKGFSNLFNLEGIQSGDVDTLLQKDTCMKTRHTKRCRYLFFRFHHVAGSEGW